MEKAGKNQAIINAIGEPIKKGPWYNASLAVAHKRHSVSCTFPVSGPQGNGVLQLKAVRNGGWRRLLYVLLYIFRLFFGSISQIPLINYTCKKHVLRDLSPLMYQLSQFLEASFVSNLHPEIDLLALFGFF